MSGRDGSAAFFEPVRSDDPRSFPTIPGLSPVRMLGRGATATVWLAREEAPFERMVAVKVLDAGRGSSEALERFRREWSAIARAAGEGVVAVFDAGVAPDGRAFLVMEHVDGEPIVEACEARSLRMSERLGLVAQVCDVVARVHAAGIVHRDLKPSNILVSFAVAPPRVTVLDFGVARVVGADRALTLEGAPIGTPEWMAPEQTGLAPAATGPATDLWAIGLLIERLWTGSAPYERGDGSAEAMRALLDRVARAERRAALPPEPRPAWDDLVDASRHELAGVMRTIGARDPAKRGVSAEELAGRLRHVATARRGAAAGMRGRRYAAAGAVALACSVGSIWYFAQPSELVRDAVPAAGLPVMAFGRDDDGRCSLPRDVPCIAIAAGADFSLAVRADGIVLGAGAAGTAAANIPEELRRAETARVVEVAAREASGAALRGDGSVVCWGYRDSFAAVAARRVRSIDARRTALAAVLDDGSIRIDAPAPGGMISLPADTRFSRVVVGHKTAAALVGSGEVVAWGSDATGIVTEIATAAAGVRVRDLDFAGHDSPSSMLGMVEADGRVRILGGTPPGGVPERMGEWRAMAIAGAVDADWFVVALRDGGLAFVGAVPEAVLAGGRAVTTRVVRVEAGAEHVVALCP